MELTKPNKTYYYIISTIVLLILLLGSWWLFLVFKLANKLQDLNHELLKGNLVSMIKWEGATFILLLLGLTVTLVYIYIQDHKKSSSIHAFFASLTHELKTPLASMKLQSEVLAEHIQNLSSKEEQTKLLRYTQIIQNDSLRLEDQLDNHLQLSRVERDAPLNLTDINFVQFIKGQKQRYKNLIQINTEFNNTTTIKADDFALQVIIRNFIENAIVHCDTQSPYLEIKQDPHTSNAFIISSNGKTFTGDKKRLGLLFYKHNSPKGSGIGLYLIRSLMEQMGGNFVIETHSKLTFILTFPSIKKENNYE